VGSIRKRKGSNCLFFDFRYMGKRCREQTTLQDTTSNRTKMKKMMDRIEVEIALGSFKYRDYFPASSMLKVFEELEQGRPGDTPLFKDFASEWYDEMIVEWKESYADTVSLNIRVHLNPHFAGKSISHITKADILKFRSLLAKEPGLTNEFLSPSRVNHVMTTLRQILNEAADRYEFNNPFLGIKPLRVEKTKVDPFTLEEVMLFLDAVKPIYKDYYTVRFFTGLRSAEIDGLKWEYVDLAGKLIQVRETLVEGKIETPKTTESQRYVQLNSMALNALENQFEITGDHPSGYVFLSTKGSAIDRRNLRKRIWYPTLEKAGLRTRRPYQTRHTAATLMLASGENPEWIARQMGHTTTEMLFRVYSRFVPNLTRQDGSAYERMLVSNITQNSREDA